MIKIKCSMLPSNCIGPLGASLWDDPSGMITVSSIDRFSGMLLKNIRVPRLPRLLPLPQLTLALVHQRPGGREEVVIVPRAHPLLDKKAERPLIVT